ncbi:hypothetical protein [Litorilituus lipolyticus]|uniref:Peptidase M41 domain-containing protein n=1 Tax=Litorilituus lipolyticus TaxID=2491017 RepID=A0A502KNL8_9GAMM|nr:hypothetical protein [Litorilituus lipolyticus]TPH13270.1 hypothetical protein EPA86_13835 [Litorilituus lipolyticus]
MENHTYEIQKQFASAHEVGHIVAALSLDLKITHVTLALDNDDNPHIKLKGNISKSGLNDREVVAFYLASEKAVEIWWMKYANQNTSYDVYQNIKCNHSESDRNEADKFLSHKCYPIPMNNRILADAIHLIDNIFIHKDYLFKPLVNQLAEKGYLTGEQIEELDQELIIKTPKLDTFV